MKKYIIHYLKPQLNPHLVGYFYANHKEFIETNNLKKEIDRIKKEVENFKTSIFPYNNWKFKLKDVKEI